MNSDAIGSKQCKSICKRDSSSRYFVLSTVPFTSVNRYSLRTYPNKDTFAYLILLLGPSNLWKNDHFLGDESPSLLKKAHHSTLVLSKGVTSLFQSFFKFIRDRFSSEYSLDERG